MVFKNREHLNFVSYSIDKDGFILFNTIGSGFVLVLLPIGIIYLYYKNKLTRRQITPIILCILISHLITGVIALIIGFILNAK